MEPVNSQANETVLVQPTGSVSGGAAGAKSAEPSPGPSQSTQSNVGPAAISPCTQAELPVVAEIIHDSAQAYRGVIPADCWHDPYLPLAKLESEVAKGVQFHAFRREGRVLGVMGIQEVKDVALIRHAYVRTDCRGQGVGRVLLEHVSQLTARRLLVGTWKAATWAVRFYAKNGFALVSEAEKDRLLQTYWTLPRRQIEESVVLVDQRR